MTHKTIVGIDLGTTFSLVSVFKDGRSTILPNEIGEMLTPSAVSVAEDGTFLVGAAARARAVTAPTLTAVEFKRDMGTSRRFQLGSHDLSPEEISALVLQSLKRDAERALGESVDEAVVTVPAYFGESQRHATRAAGAIAGITVERIINEPTAAALAYGLHERNRDATIAVLDLGGGTFDVTVLQIEQGVIEIKASAGDARLGGSDFDTALADLIGRKIRELADDAVANTPMAQSRLRDAAEQAKKRLTSQTSTVVPLPGFPLVHGDRDLEIALTRDEAEIAWESLMLRMRSPIARAMSDASLRSEQIDEVLLVGGSSRMPCVSRLAASVFGRLPRRGLPPDEAVAMGAAVQAALKSGDKAVDDIVVTDVAPFTLGVAADQQFGGQRISGVFSPIIDRGTVIPVSRVRRFYTVHPAQKGITVEVYQGEHSRCADNQKLGEYVVDGLQPGSAGEQAVDIRFTYDINGILEVETVIVSTGKTAALVIEQAPGRLSPAEIEAARKRTAHLKIHPREMLPNTTALARGEALYLELVGAQREALGELIVAFRLALEAQDEQTIRPLREQLSALTNSIRRR